MASNADIRPVHHWVTREDRARRFRHVGAVVWLTGLPGSGKSTVGMALEKQLLAVGAAAYALDGDNLRAGLNSDLGFSPDDRRENVRRAAEVAALFADAGLICIVMMISPYRSDRSRARSLISRQTKFIEVYLEATAEQCAARDPKGLYEKARAGLLQNFTGVNAPYEPPEAPDLVVKPFEEPIEACVRKLWMHLKTELFDAG